MKKNLLSSDSLNSIEECRICLIDVTEDEIKNQTIVYPCECTTPVHVKCLENWLKTKYDNNISNCSNNKEIYLCETCNTKHRVEFDNLNGVSKDCSFIFN